MLSTLVRYCFYIANYWSWILFVADKIYYSGYNYVVLITLRGAINKCFCICHLGCLVYQNINIRS